MAEATDLTYLQLRQRIVGNLNRDDLDTNPLSDSSVVHQFVKDRVNYYAKEFFYSAQFIDTSKSTVIGDPWVNLPSGWQSVKTLRLLQSAAVWLELFRMDYDLLLEMDTVNPSVRSLPSLYALHQNPTGLVMAARLYCVPDLVYPLEFTMDKAPAAPTIDAEVSFWTTDAQSLIIESVCEEICRNKVNRPMKADQHKGNKEREELSLNSKSIRISGGIQARINW